MKKDKNSSHQMRQAHTQNSTTVDVSKQISTSNNYALSAAASRPLGTSPDQLSKDRRIKMPTRLQLAINQARFDIQRREKQLNSIDSAAGQSKMGSKKNQRSDSSNPRRHADPLPKDRPQNSLSDFKRILATGQELTYLSRLRERQYDAQHQQYCEMKAVNDLVYNEPTHLVSVFKDFLILDDVNEFLKRPYTHTEQKQRLNRLIQFYERDLLTSQIYPGCMDARSYPYPNYASILPEPGHYLFKNIERRQRLRDQRDYLKRKQMGQVETDEDGAGAQNNGTGEQAKEKKKEKERASARLFDTQFMESVRLRHQNISDDNQSFKFTSEADDGQTRQPSMGVTGAGIAGGTTDPNVANNQQQQNTIVNQSLLSINQYSSNAMNLKKNNARPSDHHEQHPYRLVGRHHSSSRNIENLIQEFIKWDSLMISEDKKHDQSTWQKIPSISLAGPNDQLSVQPGAYQSNINHPYELRLNTEDGEALGKQYESMFKNYMESIDTDQSVSYTQRSIRISAILGDSFTPFPSQSVQNPFLSQTNKTRQLPQESVGKKQQNSPLKGNRMLEKPVPSKNIEGVTGANDYAVNLKQRKQRSKDAAGVVNAQFYDHKKEIGPITVQITQPQKNGQRLDKSSKSLTATAVIVKQPSTAISKNQSTNDTGSGAIAKKRKSFVVPPSKNETKSLNSVRNKNTVARQTGANSSLASQNAQRQIKIQTTSPIMSNNFGEVQRTPTVGSTNQNLILLTSQKNVMGHGSSKSPSGLGTMNVFKVNKNGMAFKRNSTSQKTLKQPINSKFDSQATANNPNSNGKYKNDVNARSDMKQPTMCRVKSLNNQNHKNMLFFKDFGQGSVKNEKGKKKEGQEKNKERRSDDEDSDDTVKLEDFQEAQNNHYHKDIMEALKNYPKVSMINSSQHNVNSMITSQHNGHQHQMSQHSSVAAHSTQFNKNSQQIVDNVSQSIQSWQQQLHPGSLQQSVTGRSSHQRNGGLIDIGSNSSECNFDTKGAAGIGHDQQSQMHPFVRALISQPHGIKNAQRTSQFSQNKYVQQQSLNSLSSQDIQLGGGGPIAGSASIRMNGQPNHHLSSVQQQNNDNMLVSHKSIQSNDIPNTRKNGQARSMQRDGHFVSIAADRDSANPHNQIVIQQPDELLMSSKTLNHQQTQQLLLPRISSQPKLHHIGHESSDNNNMVLDRYKTSQNGFDLYNKDMGGAHIIPHKKIANLLKNGGEGGSSSNMTKVPGTNLNNKGSSQHLITITSQQEQLTQNHHQLQHHNENFLFGSSQFNHEELKLQTLQDCHEESNTSNNNILNAQILNSHSFQNRSRTRPQSRNYGQKSVTRSSLGGSVAMGNQKKVTQQQQQIQPSQKNFESRKGSINRIQQPTIENTKNNFNRFVAKSQGNLHGIKVMGASHFMKSTLENGGQTPTGPQPTGTLQQNKSTINQKRKSQNTRLLAPSANMPSSSQPQQKMTINNLEPQPFQFERQMPQTSIASKSLQSLQKPQSMSRLKKGSHQQSPHIIKGLQTKQSQIYDNQRVKQRQTAQSSNAKQFIGSGSLSSKSGPLQLTSLPKTQQTDYTPSAKQTHGSSVASKQNGNKKTPQQSPMVDIQNKMHTRNKTRQTQTSIGTIQSLAAVPGSFGGMHEICSGSGGGGGFQTGNNQHQFSVSKKQFGNTQPLKNLQILSSNYQITQMTQGPQDPSYNNFFQDTNPDSLPPHSSSQKQQQQVPSQHHASTISGSNQKRAGVAGATTTTHTAGSLQRNLSPQLNFQVVHRKDA